MSFRPLPAKFADHLSRLDSSVDVIMELGSGEGGLSRVIDGYASGCVRLDLRPPSRGSVCDLVGDARHVPVRKGALAVLVVGNLLRHLTPRHKWLEWITAWRRLLKPDGMLYILEDEPDEAAAAERNFADFQRFLARLMPEGRGPLLPFNKFRHLVQAADNVGDWTFGHERNSESIDKAPVLALLGAGKGRLVGDEAALYQAIAKAGLAPGGYWWAAAGPLPDGGDDDGKAVK